jgi:hypothetical protein
MLGLIVIAAGAFGFAEVDQRESQDTIRPTLIAARQRDDDLVVAVGSRQEITVRMNQGEVAGVAPTGWPRHVTAADSVAAPSDGGSIGPWPRSLRGHEILFRDGRLAAAHRPRRNRGATGSLPASAPAPPETRQPGIEQT